MSFKNILKKAKKTVVMGALTAAAVVAPVKGQAKETLPTPKDAIMVTATQDAAKKKMFEDAVRRGASREEIAQYIDFPEFIPVTKDGQFDKEKVDKYAKALAPYLKTLAERGETISAAEAYKAFKEATGQKRCVLR